MPSKRNVLLDNKVTLRKKRDRHTVDFQYKIWTFCTSKPQVYRGWEGALTTNHPMGKTKLFHQPTQSAK
jgi:hypothetical protein